MSYADDSSDYTKLGEEDFDDALGVSSRTNPKPDAPSQKPEATYTEQTSSVDVSSGRNIQPERANVVSGERSVDGKVKNEDTGYSYHSASELAQPPKSSSYLIKNWILPGKTHLVYGASGCGKTFAVLDMCFSIACPDIEEWCENRVKHGSVVYFAGEGQEGIRKRFKGWLDAHGVQPENVQFGMFDEVFHLNDSKNPRYSIENTIAEVKKHTPNPSVIVIDTLNRFLEGNENDAQDIAAFNSACTRLIREFGCAVVIISHVGKALEKQDKVRGSSAIEGAMDVIIMAESFSDKFMTLTQKKNKDAAKAKRISLALDEVTLPPEWNDEDDEPVTTLVPRYSANDDVSHERGFTKGQTRARGTFTEAVKRHGIKLYDEELGHNLAAVHIEDWRKVSYEMSSADKQSTKNTNFNRERKQLLEEDKLLTKREIDGADYYCIDLDSEGEGNIKKAIRALIQEREKAQAEKESTQEQEALDAEDTQDKTIPLDFSDDDPSQ